MTRLAAIIVAAGRGRRSGQTGPKQFSPVAGKPMLVHAVDVFRHHGGFDKYVIVVHEADMKYAKTLFSDVEGPVFVAGGKTRQESVRLGLESLGAPVPDFAFIHDAARPVLRTGLLQRLVDALDPSYGLVPALPVSETLYKGDEGRIAEFVDRAGLFAMQTPQVFPFQAILTAHRAAAQAGEKDATDDVAIARRAGLPVRMIEGDPDNIKVTWPQDFARAERLMSEQSETRIGQGFDVHAFAAGDGVRLGGVDIAHDRKLAGHSDADVVLHALTDALLGAIGAGDIGTHFPPSDPAWRDVESKLFLEDAMERIRGQGGAIANIDITVVCEAPKIGPHRQAMAARIGEICGVGPERVNIKATTTERLGFAGREEGIAAFATAAVRVPAP